MDKDWNRERAEQYTKILKLDKKLTENNIPHVLYPCYDGWIVEYYDPKGNKIGDAIEHRSSYGLEIAGFWRKDVEGNLTVDMAYEYFFYTHEKVKGNSDGE